MVSDKPADLVRLAAQARLIAAYEEEKWPPSAPSPVEVIRYLMDQHGHLMDQHGLRRTDLVPLVGSAERVGDILRGRQQLTLPMVQRLRARFGVSADLLPPPASAPAARRTTRKAAA
jgi:HTH-type transcriptional regulator/antitoxin HigA